MNSDSSVPRAEVTGGYQYDPQLGYVPAIPEPFWVVRWFRWKPQCYKCKTVFKNREQWNTHYVLNHLNEDEGREGYDARA
jgi:hypothetical protein